MYRNALLFSAVLLCTVAKSEELPFKGAKRILFLGDSITHAGHYISLIESQLRLRIRRRRAQTD